MDSKVLLLIIFFSGVYILLNHSPQATKKVGAPGTNANCGIGKHQTSLFTAVSGHVRPSETEQYLALFYRSL
jgi:hypothetical protein